MRARSAVQGLIAIGGFWTLGAIFFCINSLFRSPIRVEETVKKGDAEEVVVHMVEAYKFSEFWRPVLAIIVLLTMVFVMYLAAHEKSGRVWGTIIGVTALGLVCLFGRNVIPEGSPKVFLLGLGTVLLLVFGMGLTFVLVRLGDYTGRKLLPSSTDTN